MLLSYFILFNKFVKLPIPALSLLTLGILKSSGNNGYILFLIYS